MRQRIDDVLRALRLVQGLAAVWTAGVGVILAGLVAGALAIYSALPPWSIAIITLGAFTVLVATISWAIQKGRPAPAESPLTPIIEKGLGLRGRLATDTTVDPNPEVMNKWEVRVQDWIAEAEEAVGKVASHRLPAFKVDYIWADTGIYNPKPAWKANLLVELDIRIDRLSVLRVSL